MESPFLFRTLNTEAWQKAEEDYLKTRQPTMFWKSEDGFEFWILEEDGYFVHKTVYGDRVLQHPSRLIPS
jgi:hypothetical protein